MEPLWYDCVKSQDTHNPIYEERKDKQKPLFLSQQTLFMLAAC